jgi:hypothetical protein
MRKRVQDRSYQNLVEKLKEYHKKSFETHEALFKPWFNEVRASEKSKYGEDRVWGYITEKKLSGYSKEMEGKKYILKCSEKGYSKDVVVYGSDLELIVATTPDEDLPTLINEKACESFLKDRFNGVTKAIPFRQDLVNQFFFYEHVSGLRYRALHTVEEALSRKITHDFYASTDDRLKMDMTKLIILEISGEELFFVKDSYGFKVLSSMEYHKKVV